MRKPSTYQLPRLTDHEWHVIAAVIPRPKAGPPPRHDREIMDAVCYARAADCSVEALPAGYPNPMSIRTRLQRWQHSGALPAILEAAQPAVERVYIAYWDHLHWLSYGMGWKFNRAKDDPELAFPGRRTAHGSHGRPPGADGRAARGRYSNFSR